MVVTAFWPRAETLVWQARSALPSRWMVQAPHSPMPQPYFVPTRPSESRRTHNIGVSGATSTEWVLPLTLSVYLAMSVRRSKGGVTEGTHRASGSHDEPHERCADGCGIRKSLAVTPNRGDFNRSPSPEPASLRQRVHGVARDRSDDTGTV